MFDRWSLSLVGRDSLVLGVGRELHKEHAPGLVSAFSLFTPELPGDRDGMAFRRRSCQKAFDPSDAFVRRPIA